MEITPQRRFEHRPVDIQIDVVVLSLVSKVEMSGAVAKLEASGDNSITTIQFASSEVVDTSSNYAPVATHEPTAICLQFHTPKETGSYLLLEGYEFHVEDGKWQVYERLLSGADKVAELHKGYLGQHHITQLERAVAEADYTFVAEQEQDTGVRSLVTKLAERLKLTSLFVSCGLLHVPSEVLQVMQTLEKAHELVVDTTPSDDVSNTLLDIIDANEMSYAQSVVFYGEEGERCYVHKNPDGAVIAVRCEFAPIDGESANVQRIVELTLVGDVFHSTETLQAIDNSGIRTERSKPVILDFTTACDILTIAHTSDTIDELK